MTKEAPIFIHFSFYVTFFLFLSHANSKTQEQGILLNLKQLWGNPKSLRHWIPTNSSSHCSWPEITCSNDSIIGLSFRDYNINGTVPPFICNLKNLTTFDIYNNSFHSTEFPRALYNCSKLEILDLSQNYFYGAIPDDIHRMSQLRELSLEGNNFDSNISASIGQLTELRKLMLVQCPFTGSFPPEIGNLSNLENLGLAYNSKMVPTLPSEFGKLKKLKFLWMARTNLIGEIPNTIGEMPALEHLDLSQNNLTGELPERLARNLSLLEMNNNRFSGKIPQGVSYWRNLLVLKASNNQFNGMIPQDLSRLTDLWLDRNRLSGSLPSDINSWKSLNTLNLSRNAISGQIPEELGSLPGLTELDLSENQLSGLIPPKLGLLKLTSLNLSSNHMTGSIPSEFENDAYAYSFLNNPSLCANRPSRSLNLKNCSSRRQKSSKTSYQLIAWIIGLVVAVLLGLFISFFVNINYKKRKHGFHLTWKLISFQKLNFTESDILSGLIENNLIGFGGSGQVYRVAIHHSSDIVAVKKIWNNRKQEEKLEKEFLAEVKILSSIRHANIVKLLCCISNDNSKLLVYEYLDNRSLDCWLHRKSRAITFSSSVSHVVLDWPKRLHIAVGAAQGLSYMHHDCSLPIVHRDVKSSNILLDLNFNAQIADFGLAKMLVKEGEPTTMSGVAGSFGYIAPEYARTTRINEKIDVYSFGVILLELTTGRKANDGDEHTSLAEWALQHIQDGKPIIDALDEEVKEPCHLNEMCHVFRLGLYCTGTQPSTRPSMKKVLKVLLQCSQPIRNGEMNAAT